MNLTTKNKVKQHIGIPLSVKSKDSLIEEIVVGASAFIEDYTKRKFEVSDYVEIQDGIGQDEIFLSQFPIVDIVSLNIGGSEVNLDLEEESGLFIVNKESGAVYRSGGFGHGRKSVKVKYKAGYNLPIDSDESGVSPYESGAEDDLPASIETAAIRLSARVYERRTAEGVSSVSPGSMSVQYKDSVDSDIVKILDAYKKISI